MLIYFDAQEVMNKRKTELILEIIAIKDYKYNPNGKYYICKYKNMSFTLPLITFILDGCREYGDFAKKLKNNLEEHIK